MQLKHWMATAATLATFTCAQAQVVLSESFANVPGLSSSGWAQTNNSVSPVASPAWFQGNTTVFPALSGTANAYAGVSFAGTNAASGGISSWLITPQLAFLNTSSVNFQVRTAGEGFLDTLEVRLSTSGSSSNVGATPTSLGDFSTLLGTYSSSTDAGWVTQTYNFSGGSTGRIAFRFVVADVATAGNYMGLDNVNITTVPEPATYALFALGLAGVMLRRRLSN